MRIADSLWVEWKIALRFLADNRLQTLMITLGIAVGSAVIVFITALITGLQSNIIHRTLGTQSHIRLLAPDEANVLQPARKGERLFVLETPRAQRLRSIRNWQDVLVALDAAPDVRAASPLISGPALAVRGAARNSVALMGVEPDRYERIVPMRPNMVAGRFEVGGGHVVIGTKLAEAAKKIRADLPFLICTGYNDQVGEATAAGLTITPNSTEAATTRTSILRRGTRSAISRNSRALSWYLSPAERMMHNCK